VTLLLAGELGKKVIIALQWLGIEICRGAGKPPPE
jgi:formate-dependent phosphoribosylglycinamide formyltransferase (GAR transformylase)